MLNVIQRFVNGCSTQLLLPFNEKSLINDCAFESICESRISRPSEKIVNSNQVNEWDRFDSMQVLCTIKRVRFFIAIV